jgi:RimJ/RimL family protein N-acetyltransferase
MIQGENITIRPINENELAELASFENDIEGRGDFLPIWTKSESTYLNEYRKNGLIAELAEKFLIVDKTGKMIGAIWFFNSLSYFESLDIGCHVFNTGQRKKGIATEAVALIVNYIFRAKQVNRLEIRFIVENEASERIAENLGFTYEGISRQAVFAQGKMHDIKNYSLLRSEYNAT